MLQGLAYDLLICCDLQVDQHVEDLKLVCRGQEDVVIAGQLARKALKPRHITIVGSNTDSSSAAVAALLAIEQHHPMFQRVQSLMFQGNLPNNLPQVGEEPLLESVL
jgi:hypothetical protein